MVDTRRVDDLAWRVMRWSMVLLCVSLVLATIRVPYAIEAPGPVSDTLASRGEGSSAQRVVDVEGHRTYPTSGHLYFTTVTVQGGPEEHITLWEWVLGKVDRDAKVVPEQTVFGTGRSEEEIQQLNAAEMQGSQKSAIAVALRSTGEDVPQDNVVASIASDLPADGRLELRDEVTAVDGAATEHVSDVVSAISDREPGEDVRLTVRRKGAEREITLRTADLGGGRAGIGVGLEPLFDYPYEVRIDAGEVGGPSAGTMFALAVRDLVTPGEMTGGRSVAGTGTIDDSGQVGPIGGIRQKMIGARDAGAEYFLAPTDNCDEVAGHVPDGLTVLEVDDFDAAVDAVEGAAKGEVGELPSCGTR